MRTETQILPSLLMPVCNEAGPIGANVRRVRDISVAVIGHGFVLVENGARDDARAVLERLQRWR